MENGKRIELCILHAMNRVLKMEIGMQNIIILFKFFIEEQYKNKEKLKRMQNIYNFSFVLNYITTH